MTATDPAADKVAANVAPAPAPSAAGQSAGAGTGAGANPVAFSIELAHVTKRFGGNTVIADLSLRSPAGATVGMIGLNGAGKTTIIRIIVGLLAPDAGSVRVAGLDVPQQRDALKPLVGYVPD